MKLDDWQQAILETKGNIVVRAGRQTGKSTIISIKAAHYAMDNPKKEILIISATERQAYLLFSKVLGYLADNHPKALKKGKDRPTKTEIKLWNGSIIRCLPTGIDGLTIRGYTTHMLIADEAHFIPDGVWNAVTPQLTTTEAIQILISTTHGREGYFYRCFQDEHFQKFHVTTEEVAEKREEPQRTNMLEHLEREKQSKSKLEYAQEYLAEFVDEFRQFFKEELIKKCCVLKRGGYYPNGTFYLGVDIARMGDDESTFVILDRRDKKDIKQMDSIVTKKTYLNETTQKIIELEHQYCFRKIGVDDGGIGVGVFDYLMQHDSTKRKTVAINNRDRPLDYQHEKSKKILKEDLYNNLLGLMERGEIRLLDDDELMLSLRSIQFEYQKKANAPSKFLITGEHKHSHIVEGLTRAAFLCFFDKTNGVWIR